MIKYSVRCAKGHEFEGWFKDSATFDAQAKGGDIACPHCGNKRVEKAPMAPRISKSYTNNRDVTHAREMAEKIVEATAAIRKEVEDNCDYVGDQFASEARKIHYGETDARGIYGEASEDETRELDDEGIEVFRIPTIRKDS